MLLFVFRPGTDILAVTYLVLLILLLVDGDLLKKAYGSIIVSWIGMKFGEIIPQMNTH